MSNLRNAPLFLTPQVTRDILGEGRARNMARLDVISLTDCGNRCSDLRLRILEAIGRFERGGITLMALASECRISNASLDEHIRGLRGCGCVTPLRLALTAKGASKIVGGGGKTMPSIGFIAVRRDGALSPMMTASEFVRDTTPRAGFWRVRAKQTDKQTHEIAAVVPPSQQGRDGDLSSPDPVVVPAKISGALSAKEPDEAPKPSAARIERAATRRVAAPVPAPTETAGTGATILVQESADPTPRRNASPVGNNWIANRFERIAAAIAFLKTRNVGVQVVNKNADIKKYRVSSHGFATFFHEEVLEIAMDMGWLG